jgi:membrane-associated phospholipid phosphatase
METHQMNKSGRKSNPVSPIFLLVLLVVSILLCGLSFFLDQTVADWVKMHDIKLLKEFARFLSSYGDWPQLMVFAFIGLGVALFRRNRTLTKLLICMMISSSLAGALINSVRLTSGRTRPNNGEAVQEWNGLWHDGQLLLFNNKYHSFPSGHSGAASAFFGVLLFAQPPYGRWTFVIAIAIGWSRVYLNVHHLSDVMVAMFLGTLIAYLIWTRLGPWIDKRLNPAPRPPSECPSC